MAEDWNRSFALEGVFNFRDFGGYRTADGRYVRRGQLYRSGALAKLTDADRRNLATLKLSHFFDLRTTAERERAAFTPSEDWKIAYRSRDYAMSLGNLRMDSPKDPDAEELRAKVDKAYGILPFEQVPSYRELMLSIAGGDLPVLVACSAGKDRTGIFAAILLDILGVDRATVVEDYCASNACADALWEQFQVLFPSKHARSREAWAPMLNCEARFIEAMFKALEREHGSTLGFCRDALSVGDDELSAIRKRLLVEAE